MQILAIKILIPKGSRLIGSYGTISSKSQVRVAIDWSRLIRPDAVDITINSPSTDQFGRSGVGGSVDRKYLQIFNNSILLSLITVGTALAADEITGARDQVSTSNNSGSTTTTTNSTNLATQEVIRNISTVAKNILQDALDNNPTITIPHGSRIKIFVNQDLIFPEESESILLN